MISESKNNRVSVLIPDGESHLLVYVVNCLGGIKGQDIFVMSCLKRNPMRFSRYIKKYIYYPETVDDKQWITQINAEISKNSIDVVMPIFEKGIRRMLENKLYLTSQCRLISLPELDIFNTAINKWELAKHCLKKDISVPATFLYNSGDAIPEEEIEQIKFPVIVKPLEGFGGGMGIRKYETKRDLITFLEGLTIDRLIIQEYIHGYDIDCSILVENGKIIAYTIQKGYLPGAHPYKPHVGVKFVTEPRLLELIQSLMQSLHWNGIAHIDCRYDIQADEYKIIEVNPRIWVTVDGSYLMGVNFPFLWIQQTLGVKLNPPKYKQQHYLNLKGVVKSVKTNIGFMAKIRFLMKNTQFGFVLRDPLPTMYKFYDRSRNLVLKRLKS